MARVSKRSGCPVAASLDLFGDRWSLLIVRDLLFTDRRSFGDFMAAGEGIASNVLVERLERLQGAGIIEREYDPADRRRSMFVLTERGLDLAPVLVELVIWAARHEKTDAPPALVKQMKRDRVEFIAGLRARVRLSQTSATASGSGMRKDP
jgi:DNA-binding HxlR family transcriptional regulator